VATAPESAHLQAQVAEEKSNHAYPSVAINSEAAMMEALSDEFSRRILSSIVERAKSIGEISVERGIPPSTCYKRIKHLLDTEVIVVERIVLPPTGKKYALYRSAFREFRMSWQEGQFTARVVVNTDVAAKLEKGWLATIRKDDARAIKRTVPQL